VFQSTPSGGKATTSAASLSTPHQVSIHAFRGEGDCSLRQRWWCTSGFNPRLPGGRRRAYYAHRLRTSTFQSTPSGGKATAGVGGVLREEEFQSTPSGGKATNSTYEIFVSGEVSIHAFRGEGDLSVPPPRVRQARFNPRLPGGRRRHPRPRRDLAYKFQSTPSGGKATWSDDGDEGFCECFNPRLPGGRRRS